MKIAIMQPYFFPYIGYWQLINAVDRYIIYDDVNFIKRGWVNRNNILSNKQAHLITLALTGASQNKKINEIMLADNKHEIEKLLKTIQTSYRKAHFFDTVFPMICDILNYPEKNLALYLYNSIEKICQYLGVTTKLLMSSQLDKDNELKAEEKIIHICKKMGATEYLNAVGGMELYNFENFEKEAIKLKFLKTNIIEYAQNNKEFVPYLSIIDVMMFNSPDAIKSMLVDYTLTEKPHDKKN